MVDAEVLVVVDIHAVLESCNLEQQHTDRKNVSFEWIVGMDLGFTILQASHDGWREKYSSPFEDCNIFLQDIKIHNSIHNHRSIDEPNTPLADKYVNCADLAIELLDVVEICK